MSQRIAPHWLTEWEYAHRGLHSFGIPENSRKAAEAAMTAGFGIECDIQLSKDDVPLVFHDWELLRLTGQQGRTKDQTAAELCHLALGETDNRIWTLKELLELVDGRVPLLIEVKSKPHFDISKACAVIAPLLDDYAGDLAVMSFDPRMGEWFARHAPHHPRGLVATDTLDLGFKHAWRQPHALERAAPDFLAMDIRDLPNAFAGIWRKSAKPLLSWTIRRSDLRERALALTDGLISEGDGLA